MRQEKGLSVLSLFDGISTAQLALNQLNYSIDNYYASEIDTNAIKLTQHHFPNTIQLGDVRDVKGSNLPPIDLLVCGSPCVDLTSLRKDRQGLEGAKSGLFYEALRILQEVQPTYWLFENVGSMSWKDRAIMDELLGIEGITINSNLVSAQNRKRIYWTNLPISKANDRCITIDDILEDGYTDRIKANCVLTKNVPHTKSGLLRYLTKSIGNVVLLDKSFASLSKQQRIQKVQELPEEKVKQLFRLCTVTELERLQTLPDGYTSLLKKTPATHAIGNGFTLEVIKHLLTGLNCDAI